jgi:signal transduction histidine kinase
MDSGGYRNPKMDASAALIDVVEELSLARDLPTVMNIVRTAARRLTGADGATFVLRDGDQCYYADEDAIAPLWKGQRFPMSACISGWVMLNRESVLLPDIYADPRIPADAYRPTFVRSLVMVPIRQLEPVGALGTYWASSHDATEVEIQVLATLANSTSIALENIQLHQELERRVEERTAGLLRVQQQKEELTALIVHDLRSPANGIMLASEVRLRHQLAPADRAFWQNVHTSAEAIDRMAMNLLDVSRSENGTFVPHFSEVDVLRLVADVADQMALLAMGHDQQLAVRTDEAPKTAICDGELVRRLLQNLIDNAIRYSPEGGHVSLDARTRDDWLELRVADDGPGIPLELREAVFEKWIRVDHGDEHSRSGCGLGLSFCRLVATSHGGTISVESREPHGCVFVVCLPLAGPTSDEHEGTTQWCCSSPQPSTSDGTHPSQLHRNASSTTVVS